MLETSALRSRQIGPGQSSNGRYSPREDSYCLASGAKNSTGRPVVKKSMKIDE